MIRDRSPWFVPADYAARFMTREAEFCEREAAETRSRGCDDYVIDHYKRRAELLRDAVARVKASEVAL